MEPSHELLFCITSHYVHELEVQQETKGLVEPFSLYFLFRFWDTVEELIRRPSQQNLH